MHIIYCYKSDRNITHPPIESCSRCAIGLATIVPYMWPKSAIYGRACNPCMPYLLFCPPRLFEHHPRDVGSASIRHFFAITLVSTVNKNHSPLS